MEAGEEERKKREEPADARGEPEREPDRRRERASSDFRVRELRHEHDESGGH